MSGLQEELQGPIVILREEVSMPERREAPAGSISKALGDSDEATDGDVTLLPPKELYGFLNGTHENLSEVLK